MKNRLNVYRSSFFYLLVLFIVYALGSSLMLSIDYSDIPIAALFTFILLFCFIVIPHEKALLTFTVIVGIFAILFHWIVHISSNPNKFSYISLYTANIIFLTTITYSVLYMVTQHKQVTADTLCGAICGYFLLGYTWSFIYLLISTINPDAFSHHLIDASIHDREQHFFYFSFTTITTVGYGDILPLSNLARACSWLEAVSGQIYLAVWISQLVGFRIAQKSRDNK